MCRKTSTRNIGTFSLRIGKSHVGVNLIDLESRALAAFGEWKEFMQGALLETSATDVDCFVAGYAAGVTDGFQQCLKQMEERLESILTN